MATIYMGHASIDENGKASGGTAGDQTGKEVCKRTWYSKPWDYMAIYPDADIREKMAVATEAACANDKIGYDQGGRNTLNTKAKAVNYDLSKITAACECDCSSLMNVVAVAAGIGSYGSNGWTTSTMKSYLTSLGFKVITASAYLTSSAYCVRGAIYVKASSHTAMGLTDGANAADTLSKAGITSSSTSSSSSSSSATSEVKASAAAKSYLKSLAGTYTVTASDGLNIRDGAGTGKKVLVAIPKGTTVKCYGYYTSVSGTKWLYVQFTYKGVKYTGFGCGTYLAKA